MSRAGAASRAVGLKEWSLIVGIISGVLLTVAFIWRVETGFRGVIRSEASDVVHDSLLVHRYTEHR